ncbi:MAG: exodeoxyribonuclease VII large subunit [Lachnospiraceae bacterium]|nr:exodeoxyribonuclease VII large subunit [Lachnospiraceae bacterium]
MSSKIYSVSEINHYIAGIFMQEPFLRRLSIRGEISNCKYHTNGFIYFTLKDKGSEMAAMMYPNHVADLTFHLENGQAVTIEGEIGVYEKGGKYQLYAGKVTRDGIGNLYEKFEALKLELAERGLFAEEYKRPLPVLPRTVGIVTAREGAAIRDMIRVAGSRHPGVQLILAPALVQGAGAAASIVSGIRALEQLRVDVIIVGRGGGSIEDLWAFNEEIVAEAIFHAEVPIISAVGHETDWTIADFVADVRAATPSVAAALAVPSAAELTTHLEALEEGLAQRFRYQLLQKQTHLGELQSKLSLLQPQATVRRHRERLAALQQLLQQRMQTALLRADHQLEQVGRALRDASPFVRLESGYAAVTDRTGQRIFRIGQVMVGDELQLYLKDGHLAVTVNDVVQTENPAMAPADKERR